MGEVGERTKEEIKGWEKWGNGLERGFRNRMKEWEERQEMKHGATYSSEV